jgi:hypothetical protein
MVSRVRLSVLVAEGGNSLCVTLTLGLLLVVRTCVSVVGDNADADELVDILCGLVCFCKAVGIDSLLRDCAARCGNLDGGGVEFTGRLTFLLEELVDMCFD